LVAISFLPVLFTNSSELTNQDNKPKAYSQAIKQDEDDNDDFDTVEVVIDKNEEKAYSRANKQDEDNDFDVVEANGKEMQE
jgi:hypothetical protein